MPLLLPQLSRREFLKRAALAGAGAALAPVSSAALFNKTRDAHGFAFFSDVHIDADPATTHLDRNMAQQLTAAVNELAAAPLKPASIFVNGDLAYLNGLPGDYATFGKIIAPLRALAPIRLTLGNHDARENFWNAFPHDTLKEKSVPERNVGILGADHANWFLLDSLLQTNSAPGELGDTQLKWLEHELNFHFHRPAIIVIHHNPQFGAITTGLRDTTALMELLARKPHVKAVVYGHTHDWHVTQHASGIHLVNLPPTAYPFHSKKPCGWVRCTLAKDGAEFELRCLDTNHPQHGEKQALKWRV
jgi:3',5'-cyclic AMP phosphodiesterase CpdA